MANRTWHEDSASIIILPGGEDGEQLLNVIQEWTECWMLKPAFWVRNEGVLKAENEQARLTSTVIARNGRREIDLLDYLSEVDLAQVRLMAVRTVNSKSEHDQAQDEIVDVISDLLSHARPYNLISDSSARKETHFVRINLVFAPTKRKGASFEHLLEPDWDINLVVAPEDRSTPSRFDKSTRDSTEADRLKWHRFLISNTAVAAGIWAGQERSVFESASQFSDLSPIQGQVRVMRSFVRGVLSEGLSTRIAAEALSRSSHAKSSNIDGLSSFPNPNLEAYEGSRIDEVIDQMVDSAMKFSGGRLQYQKVELTPPPSQDETGLIAGIKYFGKTTWALLKVLPLWFFASIWNWLATGFSKLIFGTRGRKKIVGTIDFPRTNLDKDAEAELKAIGQRRETIKSILAKWPVNVMRKSEPILWSEVRRLTIGKLDGSALPNNMDHEKGTNATLVIGDLDLIIPDVNEKWELPEEIQRTLPSQTRACNWQDIEKIEELESFLASSIKMTEESISNLSTKNRSIAESKSVKEDELEELTAKIEQNEMAEIFVGKTKLGGEELA